MHDMIMTTLWLQRPPEATPFPSHAPPPPPSLAPLSDPPSSVLNLLNHTKSCNSRETEDCACFGLPGQLPASARTYHCAKPQHLPGLRGG